MRNAEIDAIVDERIALALQPKPIAAPATPRPQARCSSQTIHVTIFRNGRLGAIYDDQHTKRSALEAAHKIAARQSLPVREIGWQEDLSKLEGPDFVAGIERLHVTTNQGSNGHIASTVWNFDSKPPSWLLFDPSLSLPVMAV
jgi:hypothetical protein